MVLMPTDALPRVVSTLPLVAGSKIRPTSLRVSSRRTVGYKSKSLHVGILKDQKDAHLKIKHDGTFRLKTSEGVRPG
jgi:hypothetical protein